MNEATTTLTRAGRQAANCGHANGATKNPPKRVIVFYSVLPIQLSQGPVADITQVPAFRPASTVVIRQCEMKTERNLTFAASVLRFRTSLARSWWSLCKS